MHFEKSYLGKIEAGINYIHEMKFTCLQRGYHPLELKKKKKHIKKKKNFRCSEVVKTALEGNQIKKAF